MLRSFVGVMRGVCDPGAALVIGDRSLGALVGMAIDDMAKDEAASDHGHGSNDAKMIVCGRGLRA